MKHVIKVSLVDFAPLVTREKNRYTGFEIELWEAIARKNNFNYTYHQIPFQNAIPLLAAKKTDVVLAGLTITQQREKVMDFSHPTLHSGLRILIAKNRRKIKIFQTIAFLFSEGYKIIIVPLLVVLGFIFVFANMLYFAENGANTFSTSYFPGIFESAWLVVCSMSTYSFGDYVPHTWIGRIVTTGIILGGMAIFGLFIAQASVLMTIRKIKSEIFNEKDLNGRTVATIKNSTSVALLKNLGARVMEFPAPVKMYENLKNGEVDAAVFDAPVLSYYAKNDGADSHEIVGELFDAQNYGIGLQSGSHLREIINQTLLKLGESGEYATIYKKWFGGRSSMEL